MSEPTPPREAPCAVTGVGCDFAWDWRESGLLCTDCDRPRDFKMHEWEPDA